MSSTDVDAIISNYLHRLNGALHKVPAPRRRQLVSDIENHLREARSQLHDESETSVLNLLERVGKPEDIAAEAIAEQPEPDYRPQRRLLIAALACLVVVGLGAGIGLALAGGAARTTKTPPSTDHPAGLTVPALIGLTWGSAENTLTSAGLSVHESFMMTTATALGRVIGQNPAAGAALPPGSAVGIIVDMPPATRLPQLTGISSVSAIDDLSELGLRVITHQQFSTSVPLGEVIQLDPPAGTFVSPVATITVTTSLGPPTASP